MSIGKEGLYERAVKKITPQDYLYDESGLTKQDRDFLFAMRCNGIFLHRSGKEWEFNYKTSHHFVNEFIGERVSFFGPESSSNLNPEDQFFSSEIPDIGKFNYVFRQEPVTAAIGKYREINEDQAARIAFLFGGLIRHSKSINAEKMAEQVRFASRMVMLGEERSADAITAAISMYIISGGQLNEAGSFKGHIYHMADAIREDPINPKSTEELGLSQVARLRNFQSRIRYLDPPVFPDLSYDIAPLEGFPTVGAEFHFPGSITNENLDFWQKLAILNMSQYNKGSYIQLSRNDKGVIEVRMNPAKYPVTIANWMHISKFLPEIEKAFFTITLNRDTEGDFSWRNESDQDLLNILQAVGMLSFAGFFDKVPRQKKRDEINFGEVYLGQTVRKYGDEYEFSGRWGGGHGSHGQLGIYAGFGENLPHLAYLLSMALIEPRILHFVSKDYLLDIKTPEDALELNPRDRKYIFEGIQNRIKSSRRLNRAYESGQRVIERLYI